MNKLHDSFGAVYKLLERPEIGRRSVAGLLVIHTLLLGYSAYVHSPTLNEPGHLVAGLSIWKFGRFDIYNVNPPLVKMVAALPVMAVGYSEDWSGFYEGPGARPEIAMGENFIKANGGRSFFLFMIARWACIPFTWLGAIVCYLWARDLYGRQSGVLACMIWCFEPNIVAHAPLITPDAHATALGLAACYTFWRWLKRPTWSQAALTGVVLGLAELAKTTLIVFYLLWPLMWLVYRWSECSTMRARDWLRQAGMLTLRMLIGLYVLNLGYGFEKSLTPLKEFTFVSDLLTGQVLENTQSEICTPKLSNRFAGTWLGRLPSPFPKNYLLGIDLQQKDFEHYGRPSYLNGVWQDHGWWYYYLYACAIKVPLGLWLLGFLALFLSFRERLREGVVTSRSLGESLGEAWPLADSPRLSASLLDQFILLLPAVVIFIVVSSKTGFNEHMRYVLPAFPFFFIAVSQVAHKLFRRLVKSADDCLTDNKQGVYCPPVGLKWRFRVVPFFSTSVVGILGLWFIASSLWVYPHSLSYFNESIGGPLNGTEHLLGSAIDWGQDFLYLRPEIEAKNAQCEVSELALAYFGCFDPADVSFGRTCAFPVEEDLLKTSLSPQMSELKQSNAPRCVAISVSLLYGYPWPGRVINPNTRKSVSAEVLQLLRGRRITAHAGYSIALYDFAAARLVAEFENEEAGLDKDLVQDFKASRYEYDQNNFDCVDCSLFAYSAIYQPRAAFVRRIKRYGLGR